MVTTVFIHRREAHLSSALRAFLDHVRHRPTAAMPSGTDAAVNDADVISAVPSLPERNPAPAQW
jgi:hypothetical protein